MVRRISRVVRRAGHGVVGGVRRDHRHFLACMRHRLDLGARDFVGAEQAMTRHAVEHAVARAHRRSVEAVRPAKLRRLRQRHEKRRLAERQPLRLLAEIRERGCPDAFEISAIRRERQIEAKDLVLAQLALELNGAHRLPELDVERALGARLEQARDLHGDGRAARHDLPIRDELQRGAAEGERIDARMLEEALVLIGKQHVEITRIDLIARGGEPPAALARHIGAEQFAVAVDHGLGDFQIAAERSRTEQVDQSPRCANRHAGECDECTLLRRWHIVSAHSGLPLPPCGGG